MTKATRLSAHAEWQPSQVAIIKKTNERNAPTISPSPDSPMTDGYRKIDARESPSVTHVTPEAILLLPRALGCSQCRGKTCALVLTARFRLSLYLVVPLSVERAQGKPGADCARSPVCESPVGRSTRVKLQVQPGHPGFPRAMGYGLYVLSPVSGGFCHRCHATTGRRG